MRKLLLMAAFALAACSTPSENSGGPAMGDEGGMCGGIAGIPCANGSLYCEVEPGVCREVADYAGVCKPKPQFCTKDYRPVCGCDGETYSNACMAAASGVSVAADGMCEGK